MAELNETVDNSNHTTKIKTQELEMLNAMTMLYRNLSLMKNTTQVRSH